MQEKGVFSSSSEKLSHDNFDLSKMCAGFTTTQSDQCKFLLIGMKMKRLLKMSMFFLAVQDSTASVPSSLKVV